MWGPCARNTRFPWGTTLKLTGTIDLRSSAYVPEQTVQVTRPTITAVDGAFDLTVGEQRVLLPKVDVDFVRQAVNAAERANFSQLALGLRALETELRAATHGGATDALFAKTFDTLFLAIPRARVDLGEGCEIMRSEHGDGRFVDVAIDQSGVGTFDIHLFWGQGGTAVKVNGLIRHDDTWHEVRFTREPGKPDVGTLEASNGFDAIRLTPALERVLDTLAPALPQLAGFGRASARLTTPELSWVSYITNNTTTPMTPGDARRLLAWASKRIGPGENADDAFNRSIDSRMRANPSAGTNDGELSYTYEDAMREVRSLAAELRNEEYTRKPLI